MPRNPNLRYATIEIGRPAQKCYEALCSVELVAEWVPGVATVRVRSTDDRGRVLSADFVGMPNRGSFAYTLDYELDDEALTLRWSSPDRTLRELVGEAIVEPIDDERCRLVYGLHSWSTAIAPRWAQIELREESPAPVLEAFRRWIEKRS